MRRPFVAAMMLRAAGPQASARADSGTNEALAGLANESFASMEGLLAPGEGVPPILADVVAVRP